MKHTAFFGGLPLRVPIGGIELEKRTPDNQCSP